jgi:hypothetical protein
VTIALLALAPWAAQKQRKLNLFESKLLKGPKEVQLLSPVVPWIGNNI